MENLKPVETGLSATDESKYPPFILIKLDPEDGSFSLSHSKILDNNFICDILYSALEQIEIKLSLEYDEGYTQH